MEDAVLVLHLCPRLRPTCGEERREAVVVLLAPLLERMVVAAGALNAQAQEELGRVFELRRWRPSPRDTRPTGGLCPDVAGGGEDLADELVVRLVLVQAVADPVVEGERRALSSASSRRLLRRTALHLLAK